MSQRLIVLGTGGLAREVAMVVDVMNARDHRWDFYGFVGHSESERGKDLGFGCVLGDDEWLLSQNFRADLVIGIGYPQVRAKVLERYLSMGDRFSYPNLIHPLSICDSKLVRLGMGNVITAGCNFTCHIQVEDFNLFNLNTTVGHDAQVGNYNVINPGVNISGGVKLGDRILVGTGSQILENISVGDDVVIGAGAMVRTHVDSGLTVVGVPAQPIRRRSSSPE